MSCRLTKILEIRTAPFSAFAKVCLRIRTKEGAVKPLIINKAQQHIHAECQDQLRRIGKVRKVLLKGRQQGGSTYVGARYYKKVTEGKGLAAFILSHESKTTGKLYEMVQRYHEFCPDYVKPAKGQDSGKGGMSFPEIVGSYELGTARNAETGRGFTAQLFHGSEVAFWPFASEILAGVMQAVPNADGSEIILESTANGVGGSFYDYVMDAVKGEGQFEVIFVPWYWQDEYRERLPEGFVRTEAEELLCKQIKHHINGEKYAFELDDEQLYWRRLKINELKSLDKFKQEYPCNIEEAFLFSGRPVFDTDGMMTCLSQCIDPIKWMRVNWAKNALEPLTKAEVDALERDDKGVKFKAASGLIQVFAEPVKSQQYAVGADVAEGLEQGDFSSFDVLDQLGVQCCHYHGHLDADLFGRLLNIIGRHYNEAFLGPERNNHGHAVLLRLKDLDYPNLYIQEDLDKRIEDRTKKVGWLTTVASKPFIIDNLAALIRDESSGILCRHSIEQCFTYVIDEKGRTNAREGCFDDNVMSYAISQEMLRRMPRVKPRTHTKSVKKNWRL
ncbi:hypothetical protein J7384_17870 [Endozoicomonas sp. G2_1]|uniref:hypothetical protein n=1 Tax=Endozoicomonas sp. G2_1 TaxID=2821091 RepID=UPI001ADD3A01|nr:hypothetical protein [Endozoicomonas sp. G2_1]MBO9492234.1 hypothetical protein [Endozoicomonas sp. G2_1]